MSKQPNPLPEDWAERDSHECFFEYIALCRQEMAEGKPIPPMFQRREAGEP
jgi:hypothetical protein